MKTFSTMVAGIATALALTLAAPAFAQPYGMGPGQGMGPGMGPGHGMRHAHGWGHDMGPGPRAFSGDPATAVEARFAALKVILKITPTQETAWQALVTQAREQAKGMQAARATLQNSTGTAPERIAARAAVAKQQAEGMATVARALNGLYAVFTPEQKTLAEQQFAAMGHRGGRHGRLAS